MVALLAVKRRASALNKRLYLHDAVPYCQSVQLILNFGPLMPLVEGWHESAKPVMLKTHQPCVRTCSFGNRCITSMLSYGSHSETYWHALLQPRVYQSHKQ